MRPSELNDFIDRECFFDKGGNTLDFATRNDFSNYLPDDILVKVDRACMLNSIELRAPFLDVNVVEFAFGRIPSVLKANLNDRKILLKHLAKKLLPREFDINRKQGFSIPLREWLTKGTFRNLFQNVLLDSSCIFDKRYIEHLFKGQDSGRSNEERLYALVFFELWRREYKAYI